MLTRYRWMVVALIVFAASVFFRTYAFTLGPEITARIKAKAVVLAQYRKLAKTYADARHPGETESKKGRIAEDFYRGLILKETSVIKDREKTLVSTLRKSERDKSKRPYLQEVDSYYYLRLTRQILRDGRMADRFEGHRYHNPWTLVPSGVWYPWDLLPFLGAGLYKFLSFIPQMSLERAVSLLPILLVGLAIGLFTLLCRMRLGFSPLATFSGLLYLGLCPYFIQRSSWGWYDTDPLNVVFPIALITIITGLSLGPSPKTPRHLMTWMLVSAAYSVFWRGWLYVWLLLALSWLVTSLIHSLATRSLKSAGAGIAKFALLTASPLLLLTVMGGLDDARMRWQTLSTLWTETLSATVPQWPDIFITVGELRNASPALFAKLVGGWPFVLLGFAGLAVWLADRLKPRETHLPLILLVYFVACFWGASKYQRFTLFAVVPIALGVAAFVQTLERRMKPRPRLAWTPWVMSLVILCLIIPKAHAAATHRTSLYNATWDRALQSLRSQTSPDAVVLSWWSPGHFITAQTQRRVIFDGSTQNTPQAYWVARFFMEADERKAVGIFRMLVTSGNQACDFLIKQGFKLSEAVELVDALVAISRQQALHYLESIGFEQAETLVNLTHGSGPFKPQAVLVYNHLIQTVLGLEYVSGWDFKKAEALNELDHSRAASIQARFLDRSSDAYPRLLWMLSKRPHPAPREGFEAGRREDWVIFTNGIKWNRRTGETLLESAAFGNGKPDHVYFVKKGIFSRTTAPKAGLGVSCLIIQEPVSAGGTRYRSVIAHHTLIESLLFRLYYLGGEGLRWIKPILMADNPEEFTRIGVFGVDYSSEEGGSGASGTAGLAKSSSPGGLGTSS